MRGLCLFSSTSLLISLEAISRVTCWVHGFITPNSMNGYVFIDLFFNARKTSSSPLPYEGSHQQCIFSNTKFLSRRNQDINFTNTIMHYSYVHCKEFEVTCGCNKYEAFDSLCLLGVKDLSSLYDTCTFVNELQDLDLLHGISPLTIWVHFPIAQVVIYKPPHAHSI